MYAYVPYRTFRPTVYVTLFMGACLSAMINREALIVFACSTAQAHKVYYRQASRTMEVFF